MHASYGRSFHFVGDRVPAISCQTIHASANQKVGLCLLRLTEKLINVALHCLVRLLSIAFINRDKITIMSSKPDIGSFAQTGNLSAIAVEDILFGVV